jgi:hypothetical protein
LKKNEKTKTFFLSLIYSIIRSGWVGSDKFWCDTYFLILDKKGLGWIFGKP